VKATATNDALAETVLIANVVRAYASKRLVADTTIIGWATDLGLRSLNGGASVSDACREGRRVIDRWMRLQQRAAQLVLHSRN